ncbi:MAG: murein hydrolase activator EnvC family protein [Actinomycetota bacterium]
MRRTRISAVAILIGAAMLLAQPAEARIHRFSQAARLDDTRTKLRAARSSLDSLERTDGQLLSTINFVQGQLNSAQGLLSDAQATLSDLNAQVKSQERLIAELDVERRARSADVDKRVAALYMMGPDVQANALLTAGDLGTFVDRSSAFEFIMRGDKLALEGMGALTDRSRRTTAELSQTTASEQQWRLKVSERVALVWEALRVHKAAQDALALRIQGYRDEVASLQAEENAIEGIIYSRGSTSIGPVSISGLQWPTISHHINSPYGPRWGGFHTGIDLKCPEGGPIYAAKAGRVIAAEWGGGYGNMIIIDHGGGISTLYAHQSRLLASQGQNVSRGEQIGECGATGHATGPHLHFEVRVNGHPVNPEPYLP